MADQDTTVNLPTVTKPSHRTPHTHTLRESLKCFSPDAIFTAQFTEQKCNFMTLTHFDIL